MLKRGDVCILSYKKFATGPDDFEYEVNSYKEYGVHTSFPWVLVKDLQNQVCEVVEVNPKSTFNVIVNVLHLNRNALVMTSELTKI